MPPRRYWLCAGWLAGIVPGLACAQQTAAPGTPAAIAPPAAALPALPQMKPTVVQERLPDATAQLTPVVATASRMPQLYSNLLGDVSLITTDTLAHAGQTSLAELLSHEPGIEFVNQGGPQTASTVFIRGSANPLVLLDGMPINRAADGAAALNAIAPDSIERVEILRGPASSLYGSGAIGGVINLITRPYIDPNKPLSAWANVGGGSQGTMRYSAGLAGNDGKGWTYSLAAGYGQSTGFNATTPQNPRYNPDRDGYRQNDFSGSLGYTWQPGQKLTLQYYRSRIDGGYDAGAPWFDDRSIETLQGYALVSANRLAKDWLSTLRLGRALDDTLLKNAPGAQVYGNTADGSRLFRTRQNQLSWQNDFTLDSSQKLALAYEHLDQTASGTFTDFATSPASFHSYTRTHRSTDSYTLVYLGDFNPQHLQASLRNDRPTGFGSQTTGSLSYGYDFTNTVRGTVTGSTGFRLPSFNELYWPSGGGFIGNPNLRPEHSHNLEASLRYRDNQTEAGITYYRNRVSDLIVDALSDPANPYSPYIPVNVGNATLSGFTLTAGQRLGTASLKASLDLSNPRDNATGQTLPLRARRVLRLLGEKRFDLWRVGAEWVLSGKRYQSDGSAVGGYGVLNLTAAYDITRDVELSMRWNNVLARRYTLVEGYNTPSSTVFFNVGWHI